MKPCHQLVAILGLGWAGIAATVGSQGCAEPGVIVLPAPGAERAPTGGSNEDDDVYGYYDGDCDERDPDVNPGAKEVCDGIDNNCDGQIDEGVTTPFYPDDDADGWGRADVEEDRCERPDGYVELAGDCDDDDASVHPEAPEVCNTLDDDCDGSVDDECG